jgi:type IV pilus assembly protein PilE
MGGGLSRMNDAGAPDRGDCRCYYRHGILGGDSTMSRQAVKGFTLIELMVVLAIIGIIAAIALPSYANQVRKSRRADATSTLGDAQLRQERWRAENPAFGTLAQIGVPTTSPGGHYTISMPTLSGTCPNSGPTATTNNSYILQAAATGAQAKDTACATMALSNLCGTITKTPTSCWSQ